MASVAATVAGLLADGGKGGGGVTQAQTQTSWPKVVLVCVAGVPAAIALGKIVLVAPLIRGRDLQRGWGEIWVLHLACSHALLIPLCLADLG